MIKSFMSKVRVTHCPLLTSETGPGRRAAGACHVRGSVMAPVLWVGAAFGGVAVGSAT